jgi:acetylornithine deacetylase/succinyl-diaminopimelate desuccinylase-like protein
VPQNEVVAKVLSKIDEKLIAIDTLRLIKEPSPTLHEEAAAKLYRNILSEYGLEAELEYVQNGRPNVIAKIKGDGTGPALLIGGHIDTIFPEGCTTPRIEGGRVYGRGANDMKGSLISMAAAAGALRKAGVKLKGDLLVAAWIDHEEPEGIGLGPKEVARKIRAGQLKVDGVIIAEGPFDSIAIAQGGCARFEIRVTGQKGAIHTSTSFLRSNPILWGSMVVEELYKMDQELESTKTHRLIPLRKSIQLGIFQAGDFYNRQPEEVKIVGTIRWDPDEDYPAVERRLTGRLKQLEDKIRNSLGPQIKAHIRFDLSRESSEIEAEDKLVQTVQSATTETFGHPLPLIGWRIVADQPFFVRDAGVPALYFGPFTEDDTTAHSNNESVSVERLALMARTYAASALLFCGYNS